MLAVTDAAADAISSLASAEGQQDNGGLRFAVQSENEEGAALVVGFTPKPSDGDQVVESDAGARVYLEPQAASYLDDKVLDVQPDDQGELNFALREQA